MSGLSEAKAGLWTDYGRGNLDRWQILTTDYWAQCITAFVAVCLTLTAPYLFRIFARLIAWMGVLWSPRNSPIPSTSEARPLLDEQRASNNATTSQPNGFSNINLRHQPPTVRGVAASLQQYESSREAVTSWILRYRNGGQRFLTSTFMLVLSTILFGLFVVQIIAGIFSARIATDRAALSSSKHCGIWKFDRHAGPEASDREDIYNYQKEATASQYARNCYKAPNPAGSLECNFFYNQSIDYSTKSYQPCPFQSPEICLNGLYSAVEFDTGLVDASVLGINFATTHKFRRVTSCSPLNMNDSYVQGPSSEDINNSTYNYYYGAKDFSNSTFKTSGTPFQWLVPVYSVNTYFSSLYPDSDYWRPMPELRHTKNSTLTIMFVSSMHIYHEKASFDPIFPATETRYYYGDRDPYYYNSDPRARAFACVDTSELCSPDGQTCWSMTAPLPHDVPDTPAYWLMKWSLENSNTYDSIKWRLGTALLAQESISQSVSKPLPSNQWELEASQLFATSLARIQYDAWGIARGQDRERPGYVDVTPDDAKGPLCLIYKFNSIGYTNVSLLGFIGIPLVAFAIFVLSLEVKTSEASAGHTDSAAEAADDHTSPEPLLIGVILSFSYRWFILWPFESVKSYIEHRKSMRGNR